MIEDVDTEADDETDSTRGPRRGYLYTKQYRPVVNKTIFYLDSALIHDNSAWSPWSHSPASSSRRQRTSASFAVITPGLTVTGQHSAIDQRHSYTTLQQPQVLDNIIRDGVHKDDLVPLRQSPLASIVGVVKVVGCQHISCPIAY